MKFTKKAVTAVLMLIMVFSLCACTAEPIEANVAQASAGYVAGEDNQNFIDPLSGMVQGDGGYYSVKNSILYFYDPVQNEAYPVCDRANCTHDSSDCPAYLSMMTFYIYMPIFYYDGNLYLLGHEEDDGVERVYLYQISPKTLKRRPAAYLFDSAGSISINFFVHRGYVYFIYDGGEMEQTTARIYRTRIGNTSPDAPEKVYEYSAIGANLVSLSAYGNYIFFKTVSYTDTQGNGYAQSLRYVNIHDLKETGEITGSGYWYFAGEDGVYYFEDENTVCLYNMESKKSTVFCTLNGPGLLYGDSKYLYFDNVRVIAAGSREESERQICVYDKSGHLVTQFVPRSPLDDCYFGGDDVLIFQSVTTGETVEDSLATYYVLNKSQLLETNKPFKDITVLQ